MKKCSKIKYFEYSKVLEAKILTEEKYGHRMGIYYCTHHSKTKYKGKIIYHLTRSSGNRQFEPRPKTPPRKRGSKGNPKNIMLKKRRSNFRNNILPILNWESEGGSYVE